MGLLSSRESLGEYGSYGAKDILSPAHRAVALATAKKAIVLLRNEGELLPLERIALQKSSKIAVIGPAANDTFRLLGNYYGCSFGTWGPVLSNCSVVTPLAGIQAAAKSFNNDVRVEYAPGCEQESADTSMFADAVATAQSSDVVIAVMGLRNCQGGQGEGGPSCESEGHDREYLGLPGVQRQLLKQLVGTGKPVVLVLLNGGPVITSWASQNVQ